MPFPSFSAPHYVPIFPLDRTPSWLSISRAVGGPNPEPEALPNLWIWSLWVLHPLCWAFQLILSLLGPGNLLLSWHLGHSNGYWDNPVSHFPHCYTPLFKYLTHCVSSLSPLMNPIKNGVHSSTKNSQLKNIKWLQNT